MKDYEQLYYDTLYELNKIKNENNQLKEENYLLKQYPKNKELKEIIIKEIIRYRREYDGKYEHK